ncbi:hypothetical protein HDU76_007126 [Blyttiomyces sp. JEL0837]|nr:hypothetical protein HDU76_007126 [Blyttiomyces sp. JEL0837]
MASTLPLELWAKILIFAGPSLPLLSKTSAINKRIRDFTWGSPGFKATVIRIDQEIRLHEGGVGSGRSFRVPDKWRRRQPVGHIRQHEEVEINNNDDHNENDDSEDSSLSLSISSPGSQGSPGSPQLQHQQQLQLQPTARSNVLTTSNLTTNFKFDPRKRQYTSDFLDFMRLPDAKEILKIWINIGWLSPDSHSLLLRDLLPRSIPQPPSFNNQDHDQDENKKRDIVNVLVLNGWRVSIGMVVDAAGAGDLDVVEVLVEALKIGGGGGLRRKGCNDKTLEKGKQRSDEGNVSTTKPVSIVDLADRNGSGTPLTHACRYGHLHIVKYLILEQGAGTDVLGDGDLPLHWACISGFVDIVKFLVEVVGVAPDQKNSFGWRPLYVATCGAVGGSERGNLDVVKYLVSEVGVDVDSGICGGGTGDSLSRSCDSSIFIYGGVHRVGNHGDEFNHEIDNDNNDQQHRPRRLVSNHSSTKTPLLLAARHNHTKILEYLLAVNASLTAIDNHQATRGYTALHHAVDLRQIGIVRRLLNAGADPSIRNSFGWTPLHLACIKLDGYPYWTHEELIGILLDHGANVEDETEEGATPLYMVLGDRGDISLGEYLIKRGAKVNRVHLNEHAEAPERPGFTILHRAASKGFVDAVEMLVDMAAQLQGNTNSIDVNAADIDGSTALHIAAKRSDQKGLATVRALLKARCINVDAVDNGGRTPMDFARTQLMRELLEGNGGHRRDVVGGDDINTNTA